MPRRAKDMAQLEARFPVPTAAEKAAARAHRAEEARKAEAQRAEDARTAAARRLADIEARRAARRSWHGQPEAPHPHNPVNRPKGWRKSRATLRRDTRRHANDYDMGRQGARAAARDSWRYVCALNRED